ncbi:MAG: hypothetical protein A2381_16720 [Bdellovibrionales bacterium RIFOXYB1_FULL_37_110]|nr:MAG: hypothetical protein A2181_07725 [Bdellovibrionales bacterium RIFOXYA1_FULL_38_20]OFZ50041.1 MAG: hypothetical protein A2417_18555 [Bdellovibrionales bacterium RIFOXYC1_FULL_37_79]OFZ59947.1 MAG: hypothetical protein A2381_16720 [Bdellovibrionales bacterium RIFOXYB1_FULL_37_110]OFZ63918.1 MAG: hypothetical protein A2577_05910 [Bdellovibrionales bacterium RIFOXYD1_FULL_36_51]
MKYLVLPVLLICFIYSTTLFCYPLFFKCGDNEELLDVEISEQLQHVLEMFTRATEDDKNALLKEVCKGNIECLKQLNQIVMLVDANKNIVKTIFDKSVRDMNEGISKIDQALFELNKKIPYFNSLLACSKTKTKLNTDHFLNEEGQIKIFYPNYSNYMYILGCNRINQKNCTLGKKNDFEKVIKNSIFLGIDPYAVLALALMEGPPQLIDALYLDPIGEIDILGCSGKALSRFDHTANFDSFNTKYLIKPTINEKKELDETLKKFIEMKTSKTYEKSENFLCRDSESSITYGNSRLRFFKNRPSEGNQCCLKLSFEVTQEDDQKEITHALPYLHVKKILKMGFRKKKDPAFTLQVFNGFTDLMGGAEGVPNFRSGVNFFNDPAYGYQTMDYILNSLMSNPLIKRIVEKYNKQYGDKYPSIVCKNLKSGFYTIDSNYYFEKHKNSKRFETIFKKNKQGDNFNKLSLREQLVFRRELEDKSVYPHLTAMNDYVDQEFIDAVSKKIKKFNPHLKIGRELFESEEFISLQGYFNFCINGSKPATLEEHKLIEKSYLIEKKYFDATRLGTKEGIDQLEPLLLATRKELRGMGFLAPNHFLKEILYPEKVMKKFNLSKIIDIDDLKRLYRYYITNQESYSINIDKNLAMKEYFKKVYPQRDTVGKTSSYPFTPFTDKQIQSLKRSLSDSVSASKK